MLESLGQYSSLYILVVAIGTLTLFGLPLLITPIRWAQVLGWRIPDHTDLAVYFGRCLGGVICAMAAFAIMAAYDRPLLKFYFNFIIINFIIMIFVHIVGALYRIQPRSETVEIGFWLILLISALLFYPV